MHKLKVTSVDDPELKACTYAKCSSHEEDSLSVGICLSPVGHVSVVRRTAEEVR